MTVRRGLFVISIVLLLIIVAGLERPEDLGSNHVHYRVGETVFKHYDKMYPLVVPGYLLEETMVPDHRKTAWGGADANAW